MIMSNIFNPKKIAPNRPLFADYIGAMLLFAMRFRDFRRDYFLQAFAGKFKTCPGLMIVDVLKPFADANSAAETQYLRPML